MVARRQKSVSFAKNAFNTTEITSGLFALFVSSNTERFTS